MRTRKSTKPSFIIRDSGKRDEFREEKIRASLLRSGATARLSNEVVQEVKRRIRPGLRSGDIYTCVHSQLAKKHPEIAARYSLKRAIMRLGPAGYVFEKYVARILEAYGYKTAVGQIVQGVCVSHEVDVVARNGKKHFMIECKYHNRRGVHSDVKVALYTHSRFQDVEKAWLEICGHGDMFHQAWLVTNTKCTSEAVHYARCVNMRILAWRYPKERGLEYFIEKKGLYPITILPSLSKTAVNKLCAAGLLLARDVLQYNERDLAQFSMVRLREARTILYEARQLCNYRLKQNT